VYASMEAVYMLKKLKKSKKLFYAFKKKTLYFKKNTSLGTDFYFAYIMSLFSLSIRDRVFFSHSTHRKPNV
jgi:hypothetical protein